MAIMANLSTKYTTRAGSYGHTDRDRIALLDRYMALMTPILVIMAIYLLIDTARQS